MSDCCEHCKKPFPDGQRYCNWCNSESGKGTGKRISFPRWRRITLKDVLFGMACALAWYWLPMFFAVRDEFREVWESGSISSIFYFLFILLPTAGLWLGVALASIIASVLLAYWPGSGKRWRLLVFFAGVAIACGIGYYRHEMSFHHQADAGNFTWHWRSDGREPTGIQLAWRGNAIDPCQGRTAECGALSIHVVQDNPAWLLTMHEEGSKTRVVLFKDGEAQFSTQELGIFATADINVACWRIERVFQAPFNDQFNYVGKSLWFDKKTEVVLPICALQAHDDIYSHDGDYTTPVLLSPDRRLIAFADTDGVLRLAQVQGMQRFLACYWLSPAVPGDGKMREDGTPQPLIDWSRAVRWTENGVDFAPEYRARVLLAPPDGKAPMLPENERAARCRRPEGEG